MAERLSRKEEERINAEINKYLHQERKRLEHEVKILLLGTGESGKSTIAKQMRIIHANGYTPQELQHFKPLIYSNAIQSMKILVEKSSQFAIPISDKDAAKVVMDTKQFDAMNPALATAIQNLWKDSGIRSTFQRRSEFPFFDSAAYFFDNMDRIGHEYVPSPQDVLRCRQRTVGIVETEFKLEDTLIKMVDVGGQRNERSKWIHCFDNATAVLFVVAMSEYDLTLEEDPTTNRMHESLKVFEEICNSKWFINTAMILFLNKKDIFEQKIVERDLKVCFPEYTGGKDYEKASLFIKNKFLGANQNGKKAIYVHQTTATDTQNIKIVFSAVKDIILRRLVVESGLDL